MPVYHSVINQLTITNWLNSPLWTIQAKWCLRIRLVKKNYQTIYLRGSVQWEIPSWKIRWRTIKQNTWHLPFASIWAHTGEYTHTYMCTHKHTPHYTHTHTHFLTHTCTLLPPPRCVWFFPSCCVQGCSGRERTVNRKGVTLSAAVKTSLSLLRWDNNSLARSGRHTLTCRWYH